MKIPTFDEYVTFQNIYKSYLVCLKGKRHKNEVIDFSLELSKNLWQIYYDLKYEKYKLGPYFEFKIFDPKERMIQAISFLDRIVQHLVADYYLMPLLKNTFILDNVACQKGKGIDLAHKRIRKFLHAHYIKYGHQGYVVKLDIHKYFESINHDYLKALLCKKVKDKKTLNLLFLIIDSFNYETRMGLPMGNQTSQIFALLYLNDIDHFIKEKLRVSFYIRYMDDLLLIVPNKEEAKKVYQSIECKVEAHRLKLNPKSKYMPLTKGFEMIGWRFVIGPNGKIITTLRKSTKKRIISKIISNKKHGKKIPLNSSYKGFLNYGNTRKLYNTLLCLSN